MSGQFDGVTDAINLVDPVFPNGFSALARNCSGISVTFWLQLEAALAASAQIIFMRNNPADPNSSNSRLEVQLNAARAIQCIARAPDNSAGANVLSNFIVPVDAVSSAPKIFVAVTIDYPNKTILFYVDGFLDATHVVAGIINAATDNTDSGQASIAYNAPGAMQFFPGKLSDLRLYCGHILTADEVKTMFFMNGRDMILGDNRRDLSLRYQFAESNSGSALTAATVQDISAAQIIGSPFSVIGTPVYRETLQAFTRPTR